MNVWLGDHWFTVIGILGPVTLAEDLDSAALIGFDVAERVLGADRSPTTIYVRANDDEVEQARNLLGTTANPEHPEEVDVSRPSDALAARAAAKSAFTALFLGLGAVALLVGGVGIANVMVISVLERRSEIGLRRALGPTRRHISGRPDRVATARHDGRLAGAALGAAATGIYAFSRGWPAVVPPLALGERSRACDRRGGGLYRRAGGEVATTEALRSV